MAGVGNFIGRAICYVANELIVNGLANSRVEEELAEQMKDVSKNFESFKNQ